MKKYKGLLVLLVLATIIGGVYAVWTYAGASRAEQVQNELSIALAEKTVTGARGNITITIPDNFKIELDQDTDHANTDKWHAIAKVSGDDIIVTFTPAADAPQDIYENGIIMKWHINGPGEALMNVDAEPAPVFVDGTGDTGAHSVNTAEQTVNSGSRTKTFTITAEQIEALIIEANINLHLPTPEKHDEFKEKFPETGAPKFTLTVIDADVDPHPEVPESTPAP